MNILEFEVKNNELIIGGVSVSSLVKEYKTPLYVMDEDVIRNNCNRLKYSFSSSLFDTEIIYASKAFLTKEMVKLIDEEGLSLDVVSLGECYTAIQAGLNPSRIYFHGNNKSEEELVFALKHHVGTIVIDNLDEFLLLQSLAKDYYPSLLLRINTGVEAHTHEYIKTTTHNSKFGVSILSESTYDLIERVASSNFPFLGFHGHIGSQIFETSSFKEHVDEMMKYTLNAEKRLNIKVTVLNLGGGFGVKYTSEDHNQPIEDFMKVIIESAEEKQEELGLGIKKLLIEPGRFIVAEAGVTLYQVGSTKKTYSGMNYVFVDGSMADHIRTALYQATYSASLANKMNETEDTLYTIAGKACESGDMIIKNIYLPKVCKNDIIAVFTTGAYHYSMASNYNRLLKPAVVFVSKGNSRTVVKRETLEDLLRND